MDKKTVEWEVREPGRRVAWKVCLNSESLMTAEAASGFPAQNAESHLHLIGLLEEIKNASRNSKDEECLEEWIDLIPRNEKAQETISIRERRNFSATANNSMIVSGIIENIKGKHMERLRNIFNKTVSRSASDSQDRRDSQDSQGPQNNGIEGEDDEIY